MTAGHRLQLAMEEFKTFLRDHGLKTTPQRLAVHEAMLKLGHASADMVAGYVGRNCDAKVTVASVYNILFGLSELGLYTHRLSSNSKMYFDVNTFEHAHLYDTVNNTYKDFIDEELMRLIHERLDRRQFRGYKVDGFDIQILCHPTRSSGKDR